MSRLIAFMARHCRAIALAALLSAAIPAMYLPKLQIDNSIEVWLPRKSEAYSRYREFQKQYGSDEFIVVAAETEDPFSPETLELQRKLAAALSGIEGVDKVWDLPSLARALWHGKPGWEDQARKTAFLRTLVLGRDDKTAGMFIWLKTLHGPVARRNTVEAIEAAVRAVSRDGFKTHLAGAPRMNVALDRASARDSALFLPLAIAVCVLTLALMLRNIGGVIAPMCAVGTSAAWTVGLMVMTGHTLNVVTTVMPTLHFVLGLSNGIRLASRFEANMARPGNDGEAVRVTLHDLILPLFFMSFTMAVGFLSLLSSDLEPVVDLGVFSAAGLMIAFLSNILIVPGVLSVFHRKTHGAAAAAGKHWSSATGLAVSRRRWTAVGCAAALLVASGIVIPRVQAESNVLKFFPAGSEIARDYAFIGEHLSGFYTVELDIHCNEDQAYDTIDAMKRLERKLLSVPGVVRVDHIGKMDELAKLLAQKSSEPSGESPFSGLSERFYYEADGQVAMRLCVLVNTMGSSQFYPLLASIDKYAKETLPAASKFYITGIVSLLNDAQRALVETQIKSFASAFGIIILMIGVLFRSLRAALASVLPNLLPIALTFAGMAICRVPLDAATVMIASVAIGIAVDNTIYFLARYRDETRAGKDPAAAIEATFNTIGSPIVFTSVVAAAGFGILAFAGFQPIVYFGILTGVTMLTALAGALFLTPACVQIFRVWESA